MKKLHLIDASAYIFRAYHGLRPLTAPDGTPTNAVYGYTQMLFRIVKEAGDSLIAAVFDAPGKSFRADIYPEYKANRPPAPEEIKIQIPLCLELTRLLGISVFTEEEYEADDIIATLATMGQREGLEIIIHSADKDLMQLVDETTVLYDAMRSKTYDIEGVKEKFAVLPSQMGDLLALMGDSSDNIPGVAGVGPKTAAKLLTEHGTLEGVLAAAPTVKGKLGEKLTTGAESARLSRELVELRRDVHMGKPLYELATYTSVELKPLRELLSRLGFKKVIEQVEQFMGGTQTVEQSTPVQAPKAEPMQVRTISDLSEITLSDETQAITLQLWVENDDPLRGEPTGLALWDQGDEMYYLPLGNTLFRAGIDQRAALDWIKPLLEDARITKTVYQHKHLLQICARYGVTLAGPVIDPLIISYLVDSSRDDHSLDALAEHLLGHTIDSSRKAMGTGAKAVGFQELPPEVAAACAGVELAALAETGKMLHAQMDDEAKNIYETIELPLTRVLAKLEATGILLDRDRLSALESIASARMLELETMVRERAGYNINLNSPKQLQQFLFVEEGLVPVKKTKTGFSTDAETLEILAHNYEVASWIHEYRVLAKLMGTYITALPRMVHSSTGRIHTHFNQAVAATGRLSSSDPNLQNIPIRTELGKEIREAFVAPEGFALVALDYSQIELRVLAHLCEDPTLIEAFRAEKDIHTATACEVFSLPPDEIDREMRRLAKAVNFGVIYGQTAFGLSKTLHIPMGEAKEYIDTYFERYPRIKSYMDNVILSAQTHGYARTMLGRKRPLVFTKRTRAAVERMAQNMPIQGTAADILKLAMIAAMERVEAGWPGVKMLLTVHDELVFEVPTGDVQSFGEEMRALMEGVVELAVPLKVDWSHGPNWAVAH